MKAAAATPVQRSVILAHFQRRRGHGRGPYLHNVAYHLVRIMLGQKDFDSLESLISFCDTPDNLRPWLPMEADRIIFSDGLVRGLHEILSDSDSADDVSAVNTDPS